MDLAIDGGTVITMDSERRVLPGGAVGIDRGRIVAVEGSPERLPEARRRLDARGMIVLPGLVDSHGHAGHCLTRGLGEGRADGGWETIVETIYFRAADDEFWQAESRLAALERLKFGVTTSLSMTGSSPRVDDPRPALAAATGYRELGLRHVVAAGPPNGPWPRRYVDQDAVGGPRQVVGDLDHALRVTDECAAAFADLGEDRLRFAVGPSAICPLDEPDAFQRRQLARVKRIAETRNVGLHAHAYQGMVRAAHAIDPELLGPRVCLAHCAGIAPDEIATLAETGTAASSGPLTHAFALARFGVVEALAAGVNVVFSTDGTAPDRSFDLLAQARVGAQLQRAHFADTQLLPAGRVLGMITIDAARALGMEREVGSLEPGKRADVILLDARQAHLAPEILAPLRVVGHASGHDVDTVIVDGRVVMAGRRVFDADEDAILAGAEDAFAAAWERAGFGAADPNAQHPDTWFGLRYRA